MRGRDTHPKLPRELVTLRIVHRALASPLLGAAMPSSIPKQERAYVHLAVAMKNFPEFYCLNQPGGGGV